MEVSDVELMRETQGRSPRPAREDGPMTCRALMTAPLAGS